MTQKQQDPPKEAIEEVKAHSAETMRQSRESRIAAGLIMFTLLGMALLTLVGLWVKHFWLGYVFAGVEINSPAAFGAFAIFGVIATIALVTMLARGEK